MRYLDRYNEHQKRRHEVRPGFTGLAQVHGRNGISWEEKFDWDVEYVDTVTLVNDITIIMKTIKVVLNRDGVNQDGRATVEEFLGSI